MKRTCNGCRALDSYGCALGYNTEIIIYAYQGMDLRKPLEECEKPKTYSELIHLHKMKTFDTKEK